MAPKKVTYNDIKEIREAAKEQNGILTVTLQQLREAEGFAKLGSRVLDIIANSLEANGMGYFPAEVLEDNPVPRGPQEVRVFLKGTPLGEVVNAVLNPNPRGDSKLRQISEDNTKKIEQIRAILESN